MFRSLLVAMLSVELVRFKTITPIQWVFGCELSDHVYAISTLALGDASGADTGALPAWRFEPWRALKVAKAKLYVGGKSQRTMGRQWI